MRNQLDPALSLGSFCIWMGQRFSADWINSASEPTAWQFKGVRRPLLQRPTEHGFGTELWMLKRVRLPIERMHGMFFSEVRLWRVLGPLVAACKSRSSAPSSATSRPFWRGSARPSRRSREVSRPAASACFH